MEVRTYRAKEMKDALEQVKRDLGSDALIISSRTITDGFWNKKVVEVRATKYEKQIDIKKTEKQPSTKSSVYGPIPGVLPIYYSDQHKNLEKTQSHTYGQQKYGLDLRSKPAQNTYFPMVPAPKAPSRKIELDSKEQIISDKILNLLIEKGLEEDSARFLSNMWAVEMPLNTISNEKAFRSYLVKLLADRITCEPYFVNRNSIKIIAMTGPTGSGKTTTAAKIAARESLINGERVGLISADGYRIAASEQLKQYADLIDIPLEIVQSRKEMSNAVRRLINKGINLIIIDTAGRNYKDLNAIKRLKYLLSAAGKTDIHLVLSAVTRERELQAVMDSHKILMPNKLVITKTDEAIVNGVIFNVQKYGELPISLLGTGQKVPEDLEIADAVKIASLILS